MREPLTGNILYANAATDKGAHAICEWFWASRIVARYTMRDDERMAGGENCRFSVRIYRNN